MHAAAPLPTTPQRIWTPPTRKAASVVASASPSRRPSKPRRIPARVRLRYFIGRRGTADDMDAVGLGRSYFNITASPQATGVDIVA